MVLHLQIHRLMEENSKKARAGEEDWGKSVSNPFVPSCFCDFFLVFQLTDKFNTLLYVNDTDVETECFRSHVRDESAIV